MLLPASGFERPCAPGRSWRATSARSRGLRALVPAWWAVMTVATRCTPSSRSARRRRATMPRHVQAPRVPSVMCSCRQQVQARMRQLHRLGRMPHAACAALALTPTFGYTRARAASLRRGDPCFTSLRYNQCGNPRLGGETG